MTGTANGTTTSSPTAEHDHQFILRCTLTPRSETALTVDKLIGSGDPPSLVASAELPYPAPLAAADRGTGHVPVCRFRSLTLTPPELPEQATSAIEAIAATRVMERCGRLIPNRIWSLLPCGAMAIRERRPSAPSRRHTSSRSSAQRRSARRADQPARTAVGCMRQKHPPRDCQPPILHKNLRNQIASGLPLTRSRRVRSHEVPLRLRCPG